jgi:hypothetical protein
MASTKSEKDFQNQVIDLLHLYGYRVAHFVPAQNSRGQWRTPFSADGKGFPDLVAVRPKGNRSPRVLFVELKTDSGKVSKEQDDWIGDLLGAEAEAYVWRPRDWYSIIDLIL